MTSLAAPTLLIRDALPADDGALARLFAAQLTDHGVASDAAGTARSLELVRRQGERAQLLVAVREGAAVGLLFANRFVSFERPGLGWFIEELFVAPEARRRGVARALLAELRRRAEAQGCSVLGLQLQQGHAAAAALYRELGFRWLERQALELGL